MANVHKGVFHSNLDIVTYLGVHVQHFLEHVAGKELDDGAENFCTLKVYKVFQVNMYDDQKARLLSDICI